MQVNLLTVIRPRVSLPVPDMRLHDRPPLFSSHEKLHGEHLPPRDYVRLAQASKQRLGDDLGLFYAELHRIDQTRLIGAGARPVKPWKSPREIRARTLPILSTELRAFAEEYGETYGFFDGHGWNMAFDHRRERLNGIYDFGDSGIGPLHQEFIYSNMVSADLTQRIITAYESHAGRKLDRRRIDVLTGAHRLWELGEMADDPAHRQLAIDSVTAWAMTMRSSSR
jgi:aminoglycoside phosphotransferase (APT) family kinase protein